MNEDPTPASSTDQGSERGGAATLPPHPHATPVGLGVAVVLVVLDQATKELVEALLTPGRFVPWLGDHIGWQLIYNPGGAFGLPLPHWVFLIVTVGVLVLVGRILPRASTLLAATAYGMLLAGAVGNVLDRLFRPGGEAFGSGFVVDFVAWGSFPRFNVADSAITVGFVLLVLALWREEQAAAQAEATGASSTTQEAAGAQEATGSGDEEPPPAGGDEPAPGHDDELAPGAGRPAPGHDDERRDPAP